MRCCSVEELSVRCDGLLMMWLCLSASPAGSPVDTSLLTRPSQVTTPPQYMYIHIHVHVHDCTYLECIVHVHGLLPHHAEHTFW